MRDFRLLHTRLPLSRVSVQRQVGPHYPSSSVPLLMFAAVVPGLLPPTQNSHRQLDRKSSVVLNVCARRSRRPRIRRRLLVSPTL